MFSECNTGFVLINFPTEKRLLDCEKQINNFWLLSVTFSHYCRVLLSAVMLGKIYSPLI
jgi:hypothetical protein